MDPVLNTLFPTHKLGHDGFNWWIGQVESGQNDDPKKSGRYRVRIIGTHLKECDITPTSHLPWAHVMMPVTTPWSDGGTSGSSIGLKLGSWVVGFYLDNDKQKPMIMGSIGHTAGATLLENVENDPNPGSTCKSFATFLDQERDPYKHDPLPSDDKRNSEDDGDTSATQPGQAGQIAAAIPGKGPAIFYALFDEASETNPTGAKVCVELADAKCGSEQDLKNGLQNILKDMLKANQDSGGQLGSYLVGKVNGKLTGYVEVGRKYINKAIRLVKSFIARVKGEIVKLIKKGVDELVKLILYKEVAVNPPGKGAVDSPLDPKLNPKPDTPKTKKVSNIQFLIDIINEILDDLGCSMEGLTEKIAKYITDLLFGFLMEAYSAAICLVDQLVDGIINQIVSFIESALGSILGSLQELLSIIASPLDLIGGIIKKVFDLLGISCDGPDTSCQKQKKECTECDVEKSDEDWLDKLIESIEDGPLDNQSYVCEEAKQQEELSNTNVVIIGGIFDYPEDAVEVEQLEDFDPEVPVEYTKPVPVTNLIRYTSSNITVTEGQDAVFTITRSGNITGSSSIGIKIVSQTATEGEDFIKDYDASVLGFAPNETEKTIKFKTFRDSTVEGQQTFGIRLDTRYFPVDHVVSYPSGRDFICTILDSSVNDISPGGGGGTGGGTTPYIPPVQTNIQPYIPVVLSPSTVPASTTPLFFVTPERPFYYEGESPVFKITSKNVNPGTVVSYTLDISPSDIEGGQVTGTFTTDSDGLAQVTFTLAENNDNVKIDPIGTIPQVDENGEFILDEDGNVLFNTEEIVTDIPDDNEQLSLIIDSTGDRGFITIVGENTNEPAYYVTADKYSVVEGESVFFTISTANIQDNTVLQFELAGDITQSDIGINLLGEVIIIGNRAVVEVPITQDDIIEDTKNLIFNLISNDIVVASQNVTVVGDVDEEVVPAFETKTYSVSTDKLEYNEGETIEYTIRTTNVPDGTVLQYILYGFNITADDFVNEKTFGEFVIIDGQAKVYVGIKDDTTIEKSESVTFLITGTGAFADVIILRDIKDVPNPIYEETICVTPPTIGTPITDNLGSIISIPILSSGCPYQEPPKVIITGSGIGASAIALLDKTGRVSEIRVTRVGGGYKKNTPQDSKLKCVIDSFTMISPGRGYKTAPDVYVDGKPGIAKAIIDERGYVISVQILDRSIQFSSLPKVTFNGGGGGGGASFLPSVVCLDTLEELERNGYAKIGTGRYIDCP